MSGNQSPLTKAQRQHILELNAEGLSGRKISERLAISYKAVRIVLEKKPSPTTEQKVDEAIFAALTQANPLTATTAESTSKSKPAQAQQEPPRPSKARQMAAVGIPQVLAPDHSVFEIKKGLEWLQQQMGLLLEESGSVRDQVFILDQMRQIYNDAGAQLESLYNIELLDAFIQEVTRILEEQVPEVRQRIYLRLAASGLAAGVIGLGADPSN